MNPEFQNKRDLGSTKASRTRELPPSTGANGEDRAKVVPLSKKGPRFEHAAVLLRHYRRNASPRSALLPRTAAWRRQLQQTLLQQTLRSTRDLAAATTDPDSEEAVVRWLLATNRLPEHRHACRYAAIKDQEERGQE